MGDMFRAGSALLRLSQPRQPCYKLAARYGAAELPFWFQETGFTGFYFRVAQPGEFEVGDLLDLVERPWPNLTVADEQDSEAIVRLLVPELGPRWRASLEKRLDGTWEDVTPRLFGPTDG